MGLFVNRGWNYVDCMESVVWADSFHHNQDCWKLTTFCRDVLNTPRMDEYGHGVTPNAFISQDTKTIVLVLALVSGVLASLIVAVAMRGGVRKRNDDYGDVQFSAIRTHELMVS